MQAYIDRVVADGGTVEGTSVLYNRQSQLNLLGFLPKASYLLLPHGYKASKVYSYIGPDLTLTRASARRRNSPTIIEAITNNIPAIDYTFGVPELSVEAARTNSILQASVFDSTTWAGKVNITVTPNAAIAPDGTQTAEKISDTVTNGGHNISQGIPGSVTLGAYYTFSVYAKSAGNANKYLGLRGWGIGGAVQTPIYNLETGVAYPASGTSVVKEAYMYPVGNGWYRCVAIITPSIASSSPTIDIRNSLTDHVNDNTYAGNGGGFYIWGAMFEAGGGETSLLNSGAAATSRQADVLTPITSATSLIGQTEGTIYFEGSSSKDGNSKILGIDDGSTNNRIDFGFVASGLNALYVTATNLGVSQTYIASSFQFETNRNYKICIIYRHNYLALFADGVKLGELTSFIVPACNRIKFSSPNGTAQFYGNIRTFGISKEAITDAEAIRLTPTPVRAVMDSIISLVNDFQAALIGRGRLAAIIDSELDIIAALVLKTQLSLNISLELAMDVVLSSKIQGQVPITDVILKLSNNKAILKIKDIDALKLGIKNSIRIKLK